MYPNFNQQTITVTTNEPTDLGLKWLIALHAERPNRIGRDCTNIPANRLALAGVKPTGFEYSIHYNQKISYQTLGDIINGIDQGCRQSHMQLIKGTLIPDHPVSRNSPHFSLTGTVTGDPIEAQFDEWPIEPDDQIIGIPAHGPHASGIFSALQLFTGQEADTILPDQIDWTTLKEKLPHARSRNYTLGHWLSRPTAPLAPVIQLLLLQKKRGPLIKAIHLVDNFKDSLSAIVPDGLSASIQYDWQYSASSNRKIQDITTYDYLADETHKKLKEVTLYASLPDKAFIYRLLERQFNMGVGLLIVSSPENAKIILNIAQKLWRKPFSLGTITAASSKDNKINFVYPSSEHPSYFV